MQQIVPNHNAFDSVRFDDVSFERSKNKTKHIHHFVCGTKHWNNSYDFVCIEIALHSNLLICVRLTERQEKHWDRAFSCGQIPSPCFSLFLSFIHSFLLALFPILKRIHAHTHTLAHDFHCTILFQIVLCCVVL